MRCRQKPTKKFRHAAKLDYCSKLAVGQTGRLLHQATNASRNRLVLYVVVVDEIVDARNIAIASFEAPRPERSPL